MIRSSKLFLSFTFRQMHSYMNMKIEMAIMPLNAIPLLNFLTSYLNLCSESYSSATIRM